MGVAGGRAAKAKLPASADGFVDAALQSRCGGVEESEPRWEGRGGDGWLAT
jgi:hypothetical protein